MVGTYISAALVCAASLLVGRAVFAAAGRATWTWLEPAVGFAALVGVGGLLARVPGAGTTASIGLLALLAWAAVTLVRRAGVAGAFAPLRGQLGVGVAVTVILAAALSFPYAVSGQWGLIGVGFNNDLGLHLAWSEWLRSGFGPEPEPGYPMGPHAIAVSLAAVPRTGLGEAFMGELMAIGVLTGLTALAALRDLGPGRRILAAVLVALTYLGVSYYAQGAFKETAQALFVLAFAIGLPEAFPLPPGRRERLRSLAPLLVLLAGILFSYSFAGLAWPAAIAFLWGLTKPEFRRAIAPRSVWRTLKGRRILAAALALAALVVFLGFVGPFGFASAFGKVAAANTFGPVSPLEAFGVWPAANYRLDAAGGAAMPALAGGIAILALLVGLAWWLRRRELAVPLALGACALLYIVSIPFSGDYSLAKALTIGAPLVMLVAAKGLLAGPARRPVWRAASAVLAVVFIAGAVYSSFLALRDAPVGPGGHNAELSALRAETQGSKVLYAGQDRFAAYYLLGADTSVPLVEFPDEDVTESPTKPFDTGVAYSPIDFDSFNYFTFNRFHYLITTAAGWRSAAPPNFREVARTPSFILWERTGRSNSGRRTLPEGTEAAQLVDCTEPETQILFDSPGDATVFPDAVLAPRDAWDNGPILGPGDETSQTLDLPPGRWRLSIQYFSPTDMELTAPGFRQPLKAALDGQRPNTITLGNDGQYWPAGEFQSPGGQIEFTVSMAEPTTLQELTGWDGKAYIGKIAAVPAAPNEVVEMSGACGRWVDWFRSPRAATGVALAPNP